MTSLKPQRNAESAPPQRRGLQIAAGLFAAAGLVALTLSAYWGRQRYVSEHPKPLANVIAPIPARDVDLVRKGMKVLGATVLQTTAGQQMELDQIWKTPPRSLEEVFDYQRRTDQVLTPKQREIFRPIRRKYQSKVIDEMLAQAKNRLPPDDFRKMSDEVKRRVEKRIEGE